MLRTSIQSRLMSDVPLGIFLSGGIDSTAITALLAEQSAKPIKTFSIGFSESVFNEAPVAKQVASFFHTEHNEYYLKAPEVYGKVEEIIAGFDEPFGDSSLVPTYFVSQKSREQIKVAMGGDGGDELFGGYIKYGQIQQAKQIGMWMPASVRKRIFSALSKWPNDYIRKASRGMAYTDDKDLLDYLSMAWKKSELKNLMGRSADSCLKPFFTNLNDPMNYKDLVHLMMYADLQTYLPDDILTKVDRTSMFNSLEVRAPLLDYRLVEFVTSLPLSLKIRNKNQKYFFKNMLKNYIPLHAILNRKKMGFSLPIADWFRNELRYLLASYLSRKSIKKVELFDPDLVQNLIQEHSSGIFNHSRKLFTLLAYQIWHDRYIQKLLF